MAEKQKAAVIKHPDQTPTLKVFPTSKLNALVWKEGNIFVAKAVEVEVASQGSTRDAALSSLEEALTLYFQDENYPPSKIKPLKGLELRQVSDTYNYA